MEMMRRMARGVSAILVVAIASLGIQFNAYAGLVGTEVVVAEQQVAYDRGELLAALDRVEVRAQLVALGVDPAAAQARVAALSDIELQQMAQQIGLLPAGADAGGIVGALLLIFIILLITDILGLTNIFPFVK